MDRTDGRKAPHVIRVFPKIGAGDFHLGGSYEDHNILGFISGSPILRKLMLCFVLLFVVFPFSLVCTSLLGIFLRFVLSLHPSHRPKTQNLAPKNHRFRPGSFLAVRLIEHLRFTFRGLDLGNE